jgi:hypothetical protein
MSPFTRKLVKVATAGKFHQLDAASAAKRNPALDPSAFLWPDTNSMCRRRSARANSAPSIRSAVRRWSAGIVLELLLSSLTCAMTWILFATR